MMIVETLMTLGVVLAALVAVLVIHLNDRQHTLAREMTAARREQRFIIDVLTIWAEHWGEDPALVKPFLETALRAGQPVDLSETEPGDQFLGFGIALLPWAIVAKLWRRLRRVHI